MAVQNDPNVAANITRVGEVGTGSTGASHVVTKPLPSSIGHYRTAIQLTMATTQAANSNLFEIRNTHATNLLVLTRCRIGVYASGTVTTTYLGKWSLLRATGFTAVDTTNTVTPTSSVKRTAGMSAYPGNAHVRHVTVAGAAAGMTGGTLTKDANALGIILAQMTTGPNATAGGLLIPTQELVDDVNGTHPLVVAQNEGWVIENTVVGSGTSNVVQVLLDLSWAEVAAF